MKLVVFLNTTKYKYGSIIFVISQCSVLSLSSRSTFSYGLPAIFVVFEAADFQYISLTKHQKQFSSY
jgi:hypothetical protein